MDITFHYPPELFELLVECIPLLFRSKKAVLLFFEGAGVNNKIFEDLRAKVEQNRDSIHKSEIVRTILTRINQKGEETLGERREILKRVIEFEDFSACWPEDMFKAKGIVSDIRRIVNVKDSFTRIKLEAEKEQLKARAERMAQLNAKQIQQQELEKIKKDFFSLFSFPEDQSQIRGKRLEDVLNRLFKFNGILIRESFTITRDPGEGITDQIDGLIELDGVLYLVEMKWWKEPLGKQDISPNLVNVFNRGVAGGIFISKSGFTKPAVITCQEALSQKTIVLCELKEFVMLFDREMSLKEFLKKKITSAIVDKHPLTYPLE